MRYLEEPGASKVCSKCGQLKPLTLEFWPKGGRGKLGTYCRPCERIRTREAQRNRNLDEKRKYFNEWNRKRGAAEQGSVEYHEKLSKVHGPEGTCKCPRHVAARQKSQ